MEGGAEEAEGAGGAGEEAEVGLAAAWSGGIRTGGGGSWVLIVDWFVQGGWAMRWWMGAEMGLRCAMGLVPGARCVCFVGEGWIRGRLIDRSIGPADALVGFSGCFGHVCGFACKRVILCCVYAHRRLSL